MTLVLRYTRAGAPFRVASVGMVKLGSGCSDAAREPVSPPMFRNGVPVRAGAGAGAGDAVVAGWVAAAGATCAGGAAAIAVVGGGVSVDGTSFCACVG